MSPLVPPPQRPRFNPFDITQPIDSPYRVEKALEGAQAAAAALAIWNVVTSFAVARSVRGPTWLGVDPQKLWLIHLAAALLAAAVWLLIRRRSPDWAVWLVLGWSILELTRYVPAHLYAHAMPYAGAGFVLLCAIQGIRGIRGRRRMVQDPASGA